MDKNNELAAIVGIGASAGGLDPLQQLLSHLDDDLNNSALIIAQHMSPNYDSKLLELLKRRTKHTIEEAKNGKVIKPNIIYIVPPNNNVEVKNNSLYLFKNQQDAGPKPSIDHLLNSLARYQNGTKRVGIILSGTGSDGANGIRALNQQGGITIAQDPDTAKYDGMPSASIDSGNIQIILSPDLIGENMVKILKEPHKFMNASPEMAGGSTNLMDQIISMLSSRIGINFSGYKTSSIYRRLEKRMADLKFNDSSAYLNYIKDNPDELDSLFKSLLIGVTKFFRDKEVFDSIREIIFRIIDQNKPDHKKEGIRIWVPGCATGEEAYTYAIILDQVQQETQHPVKIQIFATDIDENALKFARNGIYSESALENVPDQLLNQYFTKIKDKYELSKEIRKNVLFSRHDLIANPPFLRTDMISCRNLLIYFDINLQNHVIPLFHYSLKPDGYLFLGKSETIGDFNHLFFSINSKHKTYQKKSNIRPFVKLPYLKMSARNHKSNEATYSTTSKETVSVAEMVKETFYHSFEHPYAVVDENLDLIEVNGDVSHLLTIKPGAVSTNALKLIDKDLQVEFRAVAGQAIRKNTTIKGNIRRIKKNNDEVQLVKIVAKPLLFSKSKHPLYLVIFENIDPDGNYLKSDHYVKDNDSPRIVELEHELTATKEHMNTLIEELETYTEELQATNEELQSSNEELQASNEELETSNEELQSTNEELEIAYNELRTATSEIEKQAHQLAQSENNLRTIFNNTLQGFILIDKKYNIITFNKTAGEIYKKTFSKNIEAGDSYIDIIPPEEFEGFHRNFKLALEGKVVQSKILVKKESQQDIWLKYNYSPVLTDNPALEINQVSISFIDSSKQKILIDERDKLLEEITRRNRDLKKANQYLDDFVRIIAHDLRGPIGNMKMVANQFNEAAEMQEIKELLPILDQSIDRLDNTINGLVKIIETEGITDVVEPDLYFRDLLDEAIENQSDTIQNSGARIEHSQIKHQKISYIKAFLVSIIKNLLSNALKYHKPDQAPQVEITVTEESPYLVLTIKDEGIGIDLDKYGNRLFVPFKRIHKNQAMGLGVGLHIVQNMVEKNGGRIEVESEIDNYTQFKVYLKPYPLS
ncbi:MAG: CheR family methyltransferase [Candidatus Cyclobacteriaceae bacterium M3_2C_046]